jgi:hypothetical protein
MTDNKYWTLAEAIAWACTRDDDAVSKIQNPGFVEALQIQILKYRQGERVTPRISFEDGLVLRRKPVIICFHMCGSEAMAGLNRAILCGEIFHVCRHVATGRWAPIPEVERVFLEFRIQPDDPERPYGFGKMGFGALEYLTPRLSIQDVKRLSPAPRQKPTSPGEQRIYERLLEITAGKPLIKKLAMETCMDVQGCSGRAFERAWRKLSPDRKVPRGKHGQRVKH